MGAVTRSRPGALVASKDAHAPLLRCPGERAALAFCIGANFVFLALSVAVILVGTEWLEAHPFVAKHIDVIRTALLGALVAIPATIIGRQASIRAARGRGVRVGKEQLPELHEELVRACRKLGLDHVPVVYLTEGCEWPAEAHSATSRRSVILINAGLVDEHWRDNLDWLTFVMAGALGSLRLGHTRWWIEVLTVYTRFIPWVRRPLRVKYVQSCDRCAAFLVPDGIRGLLVEAVGREALYTVAMPPFLRQTEEMGGFWDQVDTMREGRPPITQRARALYEAGFFDRARDFARWGRPEPGTPGAR